MMELQRRHVLLAAGAGVLPRAWASPEIEARLREGGVVLAMRHALAPGTFDPPGFKLGECSTQRNLSDVGREQARRSGAWFKSRGLQPAAVRASPWCRCMETAQLAFGRADSWAALGSPRAGTERSNAESLAALRQALAAVAQQPGRFEVWVTHMFVLADLIDANADSGEALLLTSSPNGGVRLLGRLRPA